MILQKMGGYSNFENIVGFYNRLFFENIEFPDVWERTTIF